MAQEFWPPARRERRAYHARRSVRSEQRSWRSKEQARKCEVIVSRSLNMRSGGASQRPFPLHAYLRQLAQPGGNLVWHSFPQGPAWFEHRKHLRFAPGHRSLYRRLWQDRPAIQVAETRGQRITDQKILSLIYAISNSTEKLPHPGVRAAGGMRRDCI